MPEKTVLAIAGAGDLAKYIVDEALKTEKISIVILSREKKQWFEDRSARVSVHVTDYTPVSILSILEITSASALFSLIHSFDPAQYLGAHYAMLQACQQSKLCKRFAPSYFGGNIDKFPDYPRVYRAAHQVFHNFMQNNADGIELTVINQGWMMDYVTVFVRDGQYGEKTYMKSQQSIWPINMEAWTATIPGTGDEPAAFTSARDVAKSICALALTQTHWEQHTYVVGEQISWNIMLDKLEKYYERKFNYRENMSLVDIRRELVSSANKDNLSRQALLQILEWTALGGQGLPLDLVERQREKYFSEITYRRVDDLLKDSQSMAIV